MTETAHDLPVGETARRAAVAGVIALGGHAATFVVAYLAGLLVTPSPGGGSEDLAAVVVVFLGTQILLGLACLIVSTVLFRKGRKYTGLGLIGGWLAGLLLVVISSQVL